MKRRAPKSVLRYAPKSILRDAQRALLLRWLAETDGWNRLAGRIRRHWGAARIEKFITQKNLTLAHKTADAAFALALSNNLLQKEPLVAFGAEVRARKFLVLNAALPAHGPWPWTADWRHGHYWPPGDFRGFDHLTARSTPYDVKYPWELSRLWFLPALMQKAYLNKSLGWDQGHMGEVFAHLQDFYAKNPIANGVNWEAGEVSMRALALVLLLDMALLARCDAPHIELLLRMIAEHGEFLWRALDFDAANMQTRAANLVALLVMGAALAGEYAPAHKWQVYAAERLEEEIMRQFTRDGVHAAKSTAAHRVVTELFMVAQIVLTRHGVALGEGAQRRLHEACLYAARLMRPDGLAPVIGDTDDAVTFNFDGTAARAQNVLLSLGSALYADAEIAAVLPRQRLSPAVCWLLGVEGVEQFMHLGLARHDYSGHYIEGGAILVREGAHALFMDVGNVGEGGHNDVLGFELSLFNQPLLVDAGCPTYAGDAHARKLFRSAAYHNSLVVDTVDIAELNGAFTIADQARPQGAAYSREGGLHVLRCSHDGYRRLPDPLHHLRELRFDPQAPFLTCTDTLTCEGPHRVDRYLHFAEGVHLELRGRAVIASLNQHRFEIAADEGSKPYILAGRVSHGYGHTAPAAILMLSTAIKGSTTLIFSIKKT